MNYSIIVRPRAQQQIEDGYVWYESKLSGLGNDFILSIEKEFNTITKNPFLFQERYKSIRIVLIKRFPYGIFYFIDNETIVVVALFHLSSNYKLGV